MSYHPIGGNEKYTHIQSFGTPSAYTPGYISQAGSVGPYRQPVEPITSTINVTVDLVGAVADQYYVIGEAITPGSIVTALAINANNSLEAAVKLDFGVLELLPGQNPNIPTTPASVYAQVVDIPESIATPATPGTEPNGGYVDTNPSSPIPVLSVEGKFQYPVLTVVTPVPTTMTKGKVSLKISYISP